MDNPNSDQLIPLVDKQTGLQLVPRIPADSKQIKKNPDDKNEVEKKESPTKRRKTKLDDIILDQKGLLPQEFSSIEELQRTYLAQKDMKRNSVDEELLEWDLTNFATIEITCLNVTSDDSFLISATQRGSITVFDLQTKVAIHSFQDSGKRKINAMAVSEDSQYIFAALARELRLFDLNNKQVLLNIYPDPNFEILSVLISKDKNFLIAGGEGGSVYMFYLPNQSRKDFPSTNQGPIYSMTFSKDNLRMFAGTGDGSLRIFDFQAVNEIHNLSKVHKGPIYSIATSYDNNFLITGSADHSIKVFSLKTYEELHHFEGVHQDEVRSVTVSRDNRYIYSGSKDLSIKVLDLETKQQISHFEDVHKMLITSIALSANQKQLFSGSCDGSIMIFDLQNNEKVYLEQTPSKSEVRTVAISDDNHYMMIGSSDGYIKIFDFHFRNEKPKYLKCSQFVMRIEISSKNKFIVAGCKNSVQIFDLKSLSLIKEIGQLRGLRSICISYDERFFIADCSGVIILFDIITCQQIWTISPPKNDSGGSSMQTEFEIDSVCLSNDMKYLVIGRESECNVHDFQTQNKIFDFPFTSGKGLIIKHCDFEGEPHSVKISEDGKYVLATSIFSVQIFNLQTKQKTFEFIFERFDRPKYVTITKDNKHLVTLTSKNLLYVWDLATRNELHCYKNLPKSEMMTLAISSNDQHIISIWEEAVVKVMRIKTNKEGYKLVVAPETDVLMNVHLMESTGYVALAYSSGSVYVYDLYTKKEIAHCELGIECYCFDLVSKGSDTLFAISDGTNIKVFNFDKKAEECSLQLSNLTQKIRLKLSKDGKSILVLKSRSSIALIDLDTKQERWTLDTTEGFEIGISDDNEYFFCQRLLLSIEMYDLQTSEHLHSFKDQNTFFTLSGRYLAVSHRDASIKIFDIETKQEAHNFSKVYKESSFSLSSDNKLMVMPGDKLRIYDLYTPNVLKTFDYEYGRVAISKDHKYVVTDETVFPTSLELNYISSEISSTSVFAGYDDFITSRWPKEPETQKKLLLYYKDLYVYPHNWTMLHLLSIFQPSAISQIPEYSEYKVLFLVDRYGKTPLHYLIAQKNRDYAITNIMLKYIIDYLEDEQTNIYERQKICASLSDCFLFIISRGSPSLIQKVLKICYPETPLQYGQVIPSFGVSEQQYVYSQYPVIDSKELNKLYEEGDERIVFRTNMIPFDYDPRSTDMLKVTHSLYENEQEAIFKAPIIENLIDHLWESTKTTMYITASVFSVFMFLFSYYIASGETSLNLEISILLFTTLFLISEFNQLRALGTEYFGFVWNWIDIIQLLLTFIFILAKIAGYQEIPYEAWIVSIIIITGYLKWLSYLRLFTVIRVLIEIILVVLFDMLGFIAVIAAILVGFSLIFLEFGRYQEVSQDYGAHFYNTFKLLFGNYDDTDYDLSQIILVSFLLCVLNVVLLNLLIAIIGDSYGKVQEGRDLIDAKTRLEMIQEAMILMRTLKSKITSKKGYLIYRLPAILEEGDLQNLEWEARINKIERTINKNQDEQQENIKESLSKQVEVITQNVEQKVNQAVDRMDQMKQQVNEIKAEMKANVQAMNNMEEQISRIKSEVKEEVKNEMKSMGEQVNKIQDDIQGLNQLVSLLLTNVNEVMKTVKPPSSTE